MAQRAQQETADTQAPGVSHQRSTPLSVCVFGNLFQRWSDDAGTRRGHEARHEPAMTRTTSQQLATFASTTNFDDLTPDVRSSTHLRFLDTLGISLAASVDGAGDGVLQLVRSWGGSRDAGIIGATGQFPAAAAAFVNGT